MTLADVKVVVELIAIGVGLGYFIAERLARRQRLPEGLDHHLHTKANGYPTLGELNRRVQAIEDTQKMVRAEVRADVDGRLDGVWGAIKDLRAIDNAQQRRIDGLLGQP